MVSGMGFRGPLMKSSVVKRYIVIDGHKTSVSLEDPFWTDLKKNSAYPASDAVGIGHQDRRYARAEQSILGDPPVCSSPLLSSVAAETTPAS
jgi:hypothetical protein